MAQYKSVWASCEHGRRNRRVCVECWEARLNDHSDKFVFETPTQEWDATKSARLTEESKDKLVQFASLLQEIPTVESRLTDEGKRLLEEASEAMLESPAWLAAQERKNRYGSPVIDAFIPLHDEPLTWERFKAGVNQLGLGQIISEGPPRTKPIPGMMSVSDYPWRK